MDGKVKRVNMNQALVMGRVGFPEEIVEAAVLLASDEAQFMTGSNIVIDGGMSL